MLTIKTYEMIQKWMHQNARELEICLWKYQFEKGTKEEILAALSYYQNEDGGFGNALEPDNWNLASTPYTTLYAINLLKSIDFDDINHSLFQGIIRYLESASEMTEYGWRFSVASNDDYAHAPWWSYNEAENATESIGITAEFAAFVIQYMNQDTEMYQKVTVLIDRLMQQLMSSQKFGEMGLGGFLVLVETMQEIKFGTYDYPVIHEKLKDLVKQAIETDTTKWKFYVRRPSDFIHNPLSIYFEGNQEIVKQELDYLVDTLPAHDVWGITWSWFDNNVKYSKEFAVSENWWKAIKVIEKLCHLRNFNYIERE